MSVPRSKRFLINLLPFCLFFVAFIIDSRFSGIKLYPIYVPPVLWISATLGWPIGSAFAVFGAILSTPSSPFISLKDNIVYLDSIVARSLTLVILSILFSNYINLMQIHKKRYEKLKSLFPQCPDCGSVLCQDGQWRPIEELIANPSMVNCAPRHDCHNFRLDTKP